MTDIENVMSFDLAAVKQSTEMANPRYLELSIISWNKKGKRTWLLPTSVVLSVLELDHLVLAPVPG